MVNYRNTENRMKYWQGYEQLSSIIRGIYLIPTVKHKTGHCDFHTWIIYSEGKAGTAQIEKNKQTKMTLFIDWD